VVDTNVLLVPYTTGRASLEQIRRTFERLTAKNQLRIPAQVAREFADNRAEKLKTLFQQLSRKRDIGLTSSPYPLLEGLAAYADVIQREQQLIASLEEYRNAVGTLVDIVANWQWDDPVSLIYRVLFTESIVVEAQYERDRLLEELKYRQEHRIPPGYKDASNEYSGVGDLLIWKTILKIGEMESRHVVLVSGDEKTDWRYQSENRALYPRMELLEEFRIASKGKSFLVISFAELLNQFGAPLLVVEEVRKEEAVASTARLERAHIASQSAFNVKALSQYLSSKYPDRGDVSSPSFVLELLRELRQFGIRSIDDLDAMLDITAGAFEFSEDEDPPRGPHHDRYGPIGVVRRSLAIFDEKYRQYKYPSKVEPYLRWRKLLP
jgi:hypothetical protein